MFQGYAWGANTELWNNRRVLDYLSGVEGIANALRQQNQFVNRLAECGNYLPLVCDPPGDTDTTLTTTEDRVGLSGSEFAPIDPLDLSSDLDPAGGIVVVPGPMVANVQACGWWVPAAPPVPGASLVGVRFTNVSVDFGIYNLTNIILGMQDGLGGTIPGTVALTGPGTDGWIPGVQAQALVDVSAYPPGPSGPVTATFSFTSPLPTGTSGVGTPAASLVFSYNAADPAQELPNSVSIESIEWLWLVESDIDGRYISPEADDAPWYDPTVPESADFAGLFVEEVTGFDSTVQRDVQQGAIFGGSLGPLKLGARSMTVTGYLFAGSCCAAEYGLSWLTEALVDASCSTCAISDFFMLKCCPPDSDTNPTALDYVRTMQRVGLVDGPKVVDRFGRCCENNCGYTTLKVQFTLVAEIPYLFSDLIFATYNETFGLSEESLDWFSFCQDCPEEVPQDFDPSCGPVAPAPPEPFRVLNSCYCDPWSTKHICASFSNTAQWNQAASFIEITAGSAPIYNMKVMVWDKALPDQPCPCDDIYNDETWRCRTPCNVIEIAELPSGSTLTIDSRTRVCSLRLAGGKTLPGLRYLSGDGGGPFEWLDMLHCSTLCYIVSVDSRVADNATVTIGHAARYLASG